MNPDKIDEYTYYITVGLSILFVLICIVLVVKFGIGYLCELSML